MKRRPVMAALGASILSLAGCRGATSLVADATTTATPTPRDGHRTVRVTATGSIPAAAPLVPTVEVLQSKMTAAQTARLSVAVTNTADHPVWNTSVRIPAFSRFITQAGSDGRRLLLLTPDDSVCQGAVLCQSRMTVLYWVDG